MQRHDLDPVSLTFGLIFVGVAGAWLAVEGNAIDVADLRWFFTALLLLAGTAGTAISLFRDRAGTASGDTAEDAGVVDTPGPQS